MDSKSDTNYNIWKLTPFNSYKKKRKEKMKLYFVICQKVFVKAIVLIIIL